MSAVASPTLRARARAALATAAVYLASPGVAQAQQEVETYRLRSSDLSAYATTLVCFAVVIAVVVVAVRVVFGGSKTRTSTYLPLLSRGQAQGAGGATTGPTAAPDASPTLQMQWNALPLVTRSRLVNAQCNSHRAGYFWFGRARREVVRRPGAHADPSVSVDLRLAACGVVFPLVFAAAAALDFGDPYGALLWEGAVWLGVYAAAVGLGAWGIVHVARKVWERPERGYADGFLLCPTALIEFRGSCLRVHPLARFQGFRFNDVFGLESREFLGSDGRYSRWRVTRPYSHTVLTMPFDDVEFDFKVDQTFKARVAEMEHRLLELARMAPSQSLQAFRDIDPLFEARNDPAWPSMVASGAAPRIPPPLDGGPSCGVTRPTPWILRPPVYLVAVFALLCGSAAWLARNYVSDTTGYESIKGGGLPGLRAYVANGWLYLDEVREVTTFLEARESSEPERALQDFVRRFPRHAKIDEARAMLHARFAAASAGFAAQASESDPAVVPLMQRALAFQERSGTPPVIVRFAPPDQAAVRALDGEAATIARARGETPIALSPHFADAEMRLRERRVVEALRSTFIAVFPDAIFHLEDGGRIAPTATPPSSVRFDVSYGTAPTGAYLADRGPGSQSPGAVFDFRVAVTVPDGAPAFLFGTGVQPSMDVLNLAMVTVTQGNTVGSAACDRAFDLFSDRLRAAFFRRGSRALGALRRDDSPSTVDSLDVFGRYRATITSASSTEPSAVRLIFERGGRGVVGSYRSTRGGPRIDPGTIDGVLTGHVLAATCSNDGASGSCAFTFSPEGGRFTGMMTANGVRHYWTGRLP